MNQSSGRLIVVLCTARSGSTLLAMMLGGHHRIFAPPEMHLFRYPDFETWRQKYPKAIASLTWLLEKTGQPANETDLADRFKGKDPETIYRELLALCGPDSFLVDKTPPYARDPGVLNRIERLRPLYLWLVRHPLGVAGSLMTRRSQSYLERQRQAKGLVRKAKRTWAQLHNHLGDLIGSNLQGHLQGWRDTHNNIESFLSGIPQDRWLRVHYERLVASPTLEMERLCAWLAIEPEPEMLSPWENAPAALVWDLGDEQVLRQDQFDARGAERWRERFDERVLDQRTREIMERLQQPTGND